MMASLIRCMLGMRIGFGAAIIPRLGKDGLFCEGICRGPIPGHGQPENYRSNPLVLKRPD
jgi:hypothetical protein